MNDFHNQFTLKAQVIYPQAVGTTGATNGVLSGVIDRRGYGGVEFIYSYGTIPSTTESITPVVLECETSGGSFTSVADGDLIGTEAAAGVAAATRVSGSTKNVSKKLCYKGNKPFLKTRMYGVGTATAIVSAAALLHNPRRLPAS